MKYKLNYHKINRGKEENVNKWITGQGGIKFIKRIIKMFPDGHGLTRYLWQYYSYPGTDAGIRKYLKKHGIDLVNEIRER